MGTPVTNPPVSTTDFPAFLDRALYVGVDDQFLLQAISNVATQTVTVNYRLLLDNGTIIPGTFTYTTGNAVTLLTKTFQLAQGYLIAFEITSPAVGSAGQWLYAKMGLTRGGGTTPVSYHPLFAGYVGSSFGFGYPNERFEKPTDGRGTLRSVGISNPAAGADWTYTVPGNTVIELLGLAATLTTSAVVANRSVALILTDGTNKYLAVPSVTSIAASSAPIMAWGPGMVASTTETGGGLILTAGSATPIPTRLGPGYTIGTSTNAMDTADQWSAIRVVVREWAAVL